MNYNFRGKYDSSLDYAKLDVVIFQPTISDPRKFYLCITSHTSTSPQSPNVSDSTYWVSINSNSNFPNDVDSFITHRNILASDVPDVNRFHELSLKTVRSIAEDDELNTLTNRLRDKIITPSDFNKLQESVAATQMFLKSNIEGYISERHVEFQAELDKFRFVDEYNPTTQYRKKNLITYQGESYIARKDTIGNAPDPLANTVYWAKVAVRGVKGEKGASGTGLRFIGEYSSTTQYFKDDAVQFEGQVFACLQTVVDIPPDPARATSYWSLAVGRGKSTGTVQLTNTVIVSDTRTNVPIGIPEFNSNNNDALTVLQDTTTLTEGIHYTINANGTSVDKVSGMWDGTVYPILFEFKVLKNYLVDMTYLDGTLMQDGTLSKTALTTAFQTEINDKATTTALNTLDTELTQDIGTVQTNLNTHSGDTGVHIQTGERASWDAKETPVGANKQIERKSYRKSRSGKDITADDTFTTVEYKRRDGTLAKKSVLSNKNTSGLYTTQTTTYYEADGVTLAGTETDTITYDSDGNWVEMG